MLEIPCCEKVFPPLLVSTIIAYLSHFMVSDLKIKSNFRQKEHNWIQIRLLFNLFEASQENDPISISPMYLIHHLTKLNWIQLGEHRQTALLAVQHLFELIMAQLKEIPEESEGIKVQGESAKMAFTTFHNYY